MSSLKKSYNFINVLAGSIKAKLLTAFTAFAIIVVFIALSFFSLETQESTVSRISGKLTSINLKINEANSIQRDFFSLELLNPHFHETGESAYLSKHWKILDSLKQDLNQIKNESILKGTDLIDKIGRLNSRIFHFESLFDSLIHFSRQIGFENYGLEGELRRNIHAIEDSKYNLNFEEVLRLRKYEKDYFMRKEDKYISKLYETLATIKKQINTRIFDPVGKKKMLRHVNSYRETFAEIVDIYRIIGANDIGGIKRELSETAFDIEIRIKDIDDEIFRLTESIRDRVKMTLMILFIVFIVLNIVLAYFVVQKLGRPINILSKGIHEAINNDFKTNQSMKSIKSKDEIGQISKDFVFLLDKVKERSEEIMKRNQQLSITQENIKKLQVIGNEITSKLTIKDIIDVVFIHTKELINAPMFAVAIYNKHKDSLDFLGKKENEEDYFEKSTKLVEKHELSVLCFDNDQDLFIKNYKEEYKSYYPEASEIPEKENQSLIYLPILSKNKRLGVMTVQSPKPNAYDQFSFNILRNLAVYTAIAIDNAKGYREIHLKNQKIVDSINYAQRIQNSMLPKLDYIKKHLTNSFVLFKPRDIVSGDFYWFGVVAKAATHETLKSGVISIQGPGAPRSKTNATSAQKKAGGAKGVFRRREKSNKIVFATIDCTGHGIPGAFMSMIGKDILDTIIIQRGTTEPDIVLTQLHNGIRNALRQEETNNKDGMDMSICVVDKKRRTVDYAGAKNPLVYIQNGEVTVIKADKDHIGGQSFKGHEREFTKKTVSVKVPTNFYMFSDGFPDQIGGKEGRKYLTKRFRQLLLDVSTKPMEEQRFLLEKELKSWMKGYKQVDDILVAGFELA